MLLVAFTGLGLMVSGCAAKKDDLSTIEAQKAQYNAEVRHAWRCMLEPIKARFASSFLKKGIKAVATEIDCSGATSKKVK